MLFVAEEFTARVGSLVDQFKTRTENDIAILLSLARTSILASVTECNWQYKSLLVNHSWRIIRDLPPPSSFDECTCGTSFDCVIPAFYFLCYYGNDCAVGTFAEAVPGWNMGCTSMENMFIINLSCFFNQSCLDTIRSKYNFGIPDRLPLPNQTLAIPILNSSIISRFSQNDSLGILFSKLMIEEWNMQANFDGFYSVCMPTTCTYTYDQRLNIVYVAATVVGLLGGLTVSLRILIQLAAQLILLVAPIARRQRLNVHHQEIVTDRGMIMPITLF